MKPKEHDVTLSKAHSLSADGQFADALALVVAELSQHPKDGELNLARASVLYDWGRIREAREGFLQAEHAGLKRAAVFLNLAWSSRLLGMDVEAERYARLAAATESDAAPSHFALGMALQALGRSSDALASFRRAHALAPENVDVVVGMASCMLEQHAHADAEEWFRSAVEMSPDNARFWSHLGVSLAKQDRYADAMDAFDHARTLELAQRLPPESSIDRGTALILMGEIGAAVELYRRVLPKLLDPSGNAQYAHALLTLGRLREGWEQFEFRWLQEPNLARRPNHRKPPWIGQDLKGKTIFIRAEQGAGDFIQFARFALPLKALGATVLLEARPELFDLAKGFRGVDRVVAAQTPPPPFDYYVHLMSIPRVLETELATIPSAGQYMEPDPARVERWAGTIDGQGLKVGLAWAGNPLHKRDQFRSIPFDRLRPLWEVEGVRYFSLQKQPLPADVLAFPDATVMVDLGPSLGDFGDTAAAIARLDLVICVDTAIAHLAGALGKPVWLLLPEIGDFRWLLAREDSPWYPSMRLFRQERLGQWDEVLQRVQSELVAAARVGAVTEFSPMRTGTEIPSRSENAMPEGRPADPNPSLAGLAKVAEARHGIFQYVPKSDDLTRSFESYGEYLELQIESLVRLLRPGATIIEVGSGFGSHAVPLAKIASAEGHLFVYEPRPIPRRLLRQNLDANQVAPYVTLMRGTLTHERSSRVNGGGPAPAHGGDLPPTGAAVRVETVDELILDRLDLIKVTKEFDPVPVLKGSSTTLWRLRPLFLAALPDANSLAIVSELARSFGYRTWRMETPLFNPTNFYRVDDDVFAGTRDLALLAIPEEVEPEFIPPGCEENFSQGQA